MDFNKLKQSGVNIIDERTTYISDEAIIEGGVTIYPNNNIIGKCIIKRGAILQPNNIIEESEIGENTTVISSVIKKSKINNNVSIGPFAYIRPNSEIGDNCKVGDFVEIKASKIGDGTKVAHLTYIGDADVGKNCNMGCGVIFANYDGNKKYKTKVGNNCFIGSNCNLIAPITIEDDCFIAAGTTVTKNVSKQKFVIGRVKQQENETLAKKYIINKGEK